MYQATVNVFGINHYNPAAYLWLKAQLREYARLNAEPELYAIEWDSSIFRSIKAQRIILYQELKKVLPNFSGEELQIISNTMGFEGDAHEGIVYPKNIVWLDQGRDITCNIESYYRYHLSRLQSLLPQGVVINGLKHLIELYKNEYGPYSYDIKKPSQNRDKVFSETIIDYIERNSVSECLTVVGSKHAERKIDNSFADRLLKQGLRIEVQVFDPDYHSFST